MQNQPAATNCINARHSSSTPLRFASGVSALAGSYVNRCRLTNGEPMAFKPLAIGRQGCHRSEVWRKIDGKKQGTHPVPVPQLPCSPKAFSCPSSFCLILIPRQLLSALPTVPEFHHRDTENHTSHHKSLKTLCPSVSPWFHPPRFLLSISLPILIPTDSVL